MTNDELLKLSLPEVLEKSGTRLSAVGETRGIMQIVVKCTLEAGNKIEIASEEIAKFNSSTSKLTKVLIALNVVLVIATLINAIAAFK